MLSEFQPKEVHISHFLIWFLFVDHAQSNAEYEPKWCYDQEYGLNYVAHSRVQVQEWILIILTQYDNQMHYSHTCQESKEHVEKLVNTIDPLSLSFLHLLFKELSVTLQLLRLLIFILRLKLQVHILLYSHELACNKRLYILLDLICLFIVELSHLAFDYHCCIPPHKWLMREIFCLEVSELNKSSSFVGTVIFSSFVGRRWLFESEIIFMITLIVVMLHLTLIDSIIVNEVIRVISSLQTTRHLNLR